MNFTHPRAHYTFLILSFVIGVLYTIVNFYPDVPILTLHPVGEDHLSEMSIRQMINKAPSKLFNQSQLLSDGDNQWRIQFNSIDQQMQAKDYLNNLPARTITASPNLRANTPAWLTMIGAVPMKLGLDLRGGVHLTLNVDIEHSSKGEQNDNTALLRSIQSLDLDYNHAEIRDGKLYLEFDSATTALAARDQLSKNVSVDAVQLKNVLTITQNQIAKGDHTEYIMQRTLESIHRRVNELGLSEAIIQRQGKTHINIDLPGIQDIARAKSIIGNTATLSFHIVKSFDPAQLTDSTDQLIPMRDNLGELWVDSQSVLTGDAITYAISSNQQGKPIIQVQLNGGVAEESFYQATGKHKGQHMAIVYQETQQNAHTKERSVKKTIISAPRINQALRGQFIIEGMQSASEADTIALLLRSGSLAAPIDIVHETTVGPSLGEDNIQKGLLSIALGLIVVIVFMGAYYRLFGLIANMGLLYNLVLIMMCLSFLDATISLPSMAAIVLTVGMAVDANVLINERIREEIRSGTPHQKAISLGYDKAFATILDANVTTFIVSIVLYGLGSGMIKGFAITLIIGLFCSMLSAVYATQVITSAIQSRITNLPKALGI
jgi:preprotein translocase subunit SecD